MFRLQVLLYNMLFALAGMAHNYVVCVGVADYPGKKNDLLLSTDDAQTMQKVYEKNGKATVRLFMNEQATVAEVEAAFTQLCATATADDAIVFFFSGHGVPGAFVCVDGFLKYDRVLRLLGSSQARQKIIFADACFSGKARNSNKHADAVSNVDKSVMFFLSSRTDETSIENRKMRNSMFTAYLERGLRGGADANRDRTITAREIFEFVSKGVKEKSRQQQHPVMWGHFDDNMPLMVW